MRHDISAALWADEAREWAEAAANAEAECELDARREPDWVVYAHAVRSVQSWQLAAVYALRWLLEAE